MKKFITISLLLLAFAAPAHAGIWSNFLRAFFDSEADSCFALITRGVFSPGDCTSFGAWTMGAADTQFDITKPTLHSCRYSWDTTGTDPKILSYVPATDAVMYINAANFSAANKGYFTAATWSTNYFETNNDSCFAESNKTIAAGSIAYRVDQQLMPAVADTEFTQSVVAGGGCKWFWTGVGTNPGIDPSTYRVGWSVVFGAATFNPAAATGGRIIANGTNYFTLKTATCTPGTAALGATRIYIRKLGL